jgi:hypothetical protein
MKKLNILFVLLMLLLIVGFSIWQHLKFESTIREVGLLNLANVEIIRVRVGKNDYIVNDNKAVNEFLKLVSKLEKNDWENTKDNRTQIDFVIEPQNFTLRGHIRSEDSSNVYSYVGKINGVTFVNYGSIKSQALRNWFKENVITNNNL